MFVIRNHGITMFKLLIFPCHNDVICIDFMFSYSTSSIQTRIKKKKVSETFQKNSYGKALLGHNPSILNIKYVPLNEGGFLA